MIETNLAILHGQTNNATGARRLRQLCLWASLCTSLTLVACATKGSNAPEDLVRHRAAERWQAMVTGDISRAYSYTTPGFRAVISPEGYRGRIGSAGSWTGAEVVTVACPEVVKCVVRVRIDFKPVLGRQFGDSISTHADETWLLENGQWWLFQPI